MADADAVLDGDMPTDFSETTERGAATAGESVESDARQQTGATKTADADADAEERTESGGGDENVDDSSPFLPPPPPSSSSSSPYVLPPSLPDPLSSPYCDPSPAVRDGDHVILHFGDGRRLFAQCVSTWRGRNPPVKINKRSYPTSNLIGLPYGTVLEVGKNSLVPLPDGEDVVPDANEVLDAVERAGGSADGSGTSGPFLPPAAAAAAAGETSTGGGGGGGDSSAAPSADNRHLVDTNTSQSLRQRDIEALRDGGTHGSAIVARIVGSSSTFDGKTEFSQRKYIVRKQMKHQPRCRIVRTTAPTLCDAWFRKDPRRILNLREDALAQILSYSNVCAGSKVLVFEHTQGIVTGALAQRMGGYGKIVSLFTATQTSYGDMMAKYNLNFAESNSVKWLHAGEVFGEDAHRPVMPKAGLDGRTTEGSADVEDKDSPAAPPPEKEQKEGGADASGMATEEKKGEEDDNGDGTHGAADGEEGVVDYELADRLLLKWPCPLQPHTRNYLETSIPSEKDRSTFLSKRCNRFARKLTRHTTLEGRRWLYGEMSDRPCDSLVVATRYDPTRTLLKMMPFLASSCPFVVFSEFVEPLAECFRELQRGGLAINLRLTDAWMREYQVLPGRTHPNMTMSTSGGFILTGLKLCGPAPYLRRREDGAGKSKKGTGEGNKKDKQQQLRRAAEDEPGGNGERKRPKR